MAKDPLTAKVVRLRQEVELLAAKQAERLLHPESPLSAKVCELEARRAEILDSRTRQLGEMLDVLQRWESEADSFDTISNPTPSHKD